MSASRPWRVAVLEDDAETRQFFCASVAGHDQLSLAADFGTLGQARDWLARHEVDLLLTDLALPDGSAMSLIRALKTQRPHCEVMVVSVFGDEDTVLACIEAGAVGYLHKDAGTDDVARVILEVRAGGSPISPMIARKLLQRWRGATVPAAPSAGAESVAPGSVPESPGLTPRETDVLQLIARGFSYAEVGRLLAVGLPTVQSHIRNIYGKLAVHSRGEAVFEASRLGLLDIVRPAARDG